jgi:hypothetical protein
MAAQAKRFASTTNAKIRESKQDRREPVLNLIEKHRLLEHRANEPGIGDDETDRRTDEAWRTYQKLTTAMPRTLTAAAELASHVAKMEARHDDDEATQVLRNIAMFLLKLEAKGGDQ